MSTLILDILAARGWSVRQAALMADLNYSAVLGHLRGLPQRLSRQRLQRLHGLLKLDAEGKMQPGVVYAWAVPMETEALEALRRILREQIDNDAGGGSTAWTVSPLAGGDGAGKAARFWILKRGGYGVLVRWLKPRNRAVAVASTFQMRVRQKRATQKSYEPSIEWFGPEVARWSPGLEASREPRRIIALSQAPFLRLTEDGGDEPLSWEEFNAWLAAEPVDEGAGIAAPGKSLLALGGDGEYLDRLDTISKDALIRHLLEMIEEPDLGTRLKKVQKFLDKLPTEQERRRLGGSVDVENHGDGDNEGLNL